MNDFLDFIEIDRWFPPFDEWTKMFLWGERNTQDLIKLYLRSKWIDNFEANADRFKINCILWGNWCGKSRVLSKFIPNDYKTNQGFYDYRWLSDFEIMRHYIVDDYFKLSPNFEISINKTILEDGNFNKFYLDFANLIKQTEFGNKLIGQSLTTDITSNFKLTINFDLWNVLLDPASLENAKYNFEEFDISILLNKANWDKKKILVILYLYVKSFLNFYHFQTDEELYSERKDVAISKIKQFETEFNISKEDALISLLPSEFLNWDMDYSDASQKLWDAFEDKYNFSAVNKEIITIEFDHNEIIPVSDYPKILGFVHLYWEIKIQFGNIFFSDLSAWEKTLLIRFTNIYAEIISKINSETIKNYDDHFVLDFAVLIDEPDLHLHLEWQKRYIQKLIDVFSLLPINFEVTDGYIVPINLHFILATHSPFIISDLPVDSIIKIEVVWWNKQILTYDWKNHQEFNNMSAYNNYFHQEKNNSINHTFGANFIDIINHWFFFEWKNLIGGFAEQNIKYLSKCIKIIILLESLVDDKSSQDPERIKLINSLLLEINEDPVDEDSLKMTINKLKNKYFPIRNLIWDTFLRDNLIYL